MIGFWELDPEAGKVVFATFDRLPAAKRKAIEPIAAEMAAFLRDDLGHARSFSLDTMEEVQKRAAAIKAM